MAHYAVQYGTNVNNRVRTTRVEPPLRPCMFNLWTTQKSPSFCARRRSRVPLLASCRLSTASSIRKPTSSAGVGSASLFWALAAGCFGSRHHHGFGGPSEACRCACSEESRRRQARAVPLLRPLPYMEERRLLG